VSEKPDIVILMTDEERAIPPYESPEVLAWRDRMLKGRKWFDEHGVWFQRHYTGSLACVPSRPTIFTGQYPDLHGVTQTDGIGKVFDDSRMRWLRQGEVPTLGNWFRAAGYDTHYDGNGTFRMQICTTRRRVVRWRRTTTMVWSTPRRCNATWTRIGLLRSAFRAGWARSHTARCSLTRVCGVTR